MADPNLNNAVDLLKKKCSVIPIKWATYKDSLFFEAYDPSVPNNKRQFVTTPYYLVDLKHKKAGPFSRMFDPEGYDKSVSSLKKM